MDFDLSDDHELIRRTVRDFAEGEVTPVAEELDREKRFPYEIVAQARRARADGDPVPGGVRRRRRRLARVRARRRGAHARGLVASRSRCARTRRSAPSRSTCSAPRSRSSADLPDLCAGRKLGAFGLTEPEAGSDAGNVRTRAKLDDGGWVIDGAKQFITNAGTDISGHVAITARTGEDEISNLIVENGTPGYEQGEPYRKMGWNASDTRPLTFDGLPGARGEPARPARPGLQAVPAHPRHRPHRRRGDGRRPRAGRARRGARLRQGAQGVRQADLQVPGDPGQARRHGDRDRGGAAARPTRRRCSRTPGATSR